MEHRTILIFSILIVLIIILMSYRININFKNCGDRFFYFDNNATTFVSQEVTDEINKWLSCGNPSNILHSAGQNAHQKIVECRGIISKDLEVDPEEIYFTSGATESNNIAIQGIVNKFLESDKRKKFSIITTAFEHASVVNIFKHYKENNRLNIIFVPIQTNPLHPYYRSVDPLDVEQAIVTAEHPVILVSVMYANNETGAIQDLQKIGEITKKYKVYFHSDITQGIGKFLIKPSKLNIDAASFSGHKFHAPKGIGVLFMRNTCGEFHNLCFGGEQEASKRPGTENVAYIAGLTKALTIVHFNRQQKNVNMLKLKKTIMSGLMGCEYITSKKYDLPNTILTVLPPIDTCNKNFAKELSETYKICIGVSSACQTANTSHVLEAIHIEDDKKSRIIRISMSDDTTFGECQYLITSINALLQKHLTK